MSTNHLYEYELVVDKFGIVPMANLLADESLYISKYDWMIIANIILVVLIEIDNM